MAKMKIGVVWGSLILRGIMGAAHANASPAIATWAYPDGVSLPYRDHHNQLVQDSSAHIGVVAYHSSGIARVAFTVNGGIATSVTDETINPETDEYEYVLSSINRIMSQSVPSMHSWINLPIAIEIELSDKSWWDKKEVEIPIWK